MRRGEGGGEGINRGITTSALSENVSFASRVPIFLLTVSRKVEIALSYERQSSCGNEEERGGRNVLRVKRGRIMRGRRCK